MQNKMNFGNATSLTTGGSEDDLDDDIGTSANIPFLLVMIVLTLTGLIGNVLVIGAVFCHEKLHLLSSIFLVNLAVADLIVSVVINGFGTFSLVNVHFFDDKPVMCEIIGIVCVTW